MALQRSSRVRWLSLLFLVVSFMATLAPTATAVTFDCVDAFTLFARGSGQAPHESGGEAERFFSEIKARINESSVDLETRELGAEAYLGLSYPAAGGYQNFFEAETGWDDYGVYSESVEEGRQEAFMYLNDRAAACPNEAWVLGGYSQGAQVVGEALFSLNAAARDNVVFVALFGDPKLLLNGGGIWPPACRGEKLPWRRGDVSCWVDNGILEARNPYLPVSLENRVGSWCDKFDGICIDDLGLAAVGTHDEYGAKWMDDAALEAAQALKSKLPEKADGFDITILPIAIGANGFDVAFVIDTTGSMGDEIDSAKAAAIDIADKIFGLSDTSRVALVQYRDHGDPFVANVETNFTRDSTVFSNEVSALFASGGGDFPEAVLSGVMTALNELSWADGALKVIVLMGDAPGKDPEPITGYTTSQVMQRALEIDPVNVYPLAVSSDSSTLAFFQQLADGSDGKVFTLNGQPAGEALLEAVDDITLEPVALVQQAYIAQLGQSITFDASGSYDPDSEIVSYSWDFDNDGDVDSTGSAPTVSFTYPMPYEGLAVLVVESADGGTANAVTSVRVSLEQTPDWTPDPPESVSLDDSGDGNVVLSWQPPADATGVEGFKVTTAEGATVAVLGPDLSSLTILGAPIDSPLQFGVHSVGEFSDSETVLSNTLLLGDVQSKIDQLIADVESYHLKPSVEASLVSKLKRLKHQVAAEAWNYACNTLDEFRRQVSALSNRQITPSQRAHLLESAEEIGALIDC